MANGVNSVQVLGNLGADPELRHTQDGTAVVNMRIAVNEPKKIGDKWGEHTEWIRVAVFGKTAENCARYLRKGRQVFVAGKLRTSSYEKNDERRYSTEVIARDVIFLGGDGATSSQPRQSEARSVEEPSPEETGLYSDDLPF